MYKNVGKKIQVLAQVLGWIYLIGGLGSCIAILILQEPIEIALIALGSGFVCMLLTWGLYGFGQLIEDTHDIKKSLSFRVDSTMQLPKL